LFTASTYNAEGNRRRLARWSARDIAGSPIDTIITRWGYDRGERVVADTAPDGQVERRVYDHASNVTSIVTRREKTITMQYDALNRLGSRAVPAVTYNDTLAGIGAADNAPYPRRPNAGTDYTIGAQVETFGYDAAGRLTTANNADAHVTRDYFANGLTKSERLELRDVNTATFSHNYFTQYGYDLNGRRKLVRLPSQLASGTADSIAFTYGAATGELVSVRDPLSRAYAYAYTFRGEPRSLMFPGGYEERWSYFPDCTLRTDSIHNVGGTGAGRIPMSVLRATTFTYDRRGKRLTADDAIGYQELNRFAYNGLGYVTSAYMRQNAKLFVSGGEFIDQYTSAEQQTYDALGNIASALTVDTLRRNGIVAQNSRRGRTATYQANVGRLLSESSAEGSKRYTYDPSGNLEFSIREEATSQDPQPREDRFTYYDAQERARAVDFRSAFPGASVLQLHKWTFEEYRYDALGRRVWVLSDRDCREDREAILGVEWLECNVGTLRRAVWDGEQELVEIQVPYRLPGGAPQPDSVLENDGYVAQLPRFGSSVDPNPYFGRVLYVHGLALDQPLAIVRSNYVDFFFNAQNHIAFPPTGFSLFWNALGRLGPVACGNGQANCTATSGGRTAAMGVDLPSNWFVLDRPKASPARRFFQGTLTADKQDATGVLYRRNRYYDPSTGRFTQEDPIGLAGGINLYGFAGGDPVTDSDPFGLFACDKRTGEGCSEEYRRLLGADRSLERVTKDIEIAKTVLAVLNRAIAVAEAGEMLYRFGLGWESAGDLASQAAAAEATGRFPHGVSVWNRTNRPDALAAPRDAVQEFFGVENTGRRGHRTVVLPKPVTREEEIIFNTLFGRTPPNQR
jgi:RHS repeat-associated protein